MVQVSAAIGVGAAVGVFLLGALLACFCVRRRQRPKQLERKLSVVIRPIVWPPKKGSSASLQRPDKRPVQQLVARLPYHDVIEEQTEPSELDVDREQCNTEGSDAESTCDNGAQQPLAVHSRTRRVSQEVGFNVSTDRMQVELVKDFYVEKTAGTSPAQHDDLNVQLSDASILIENRREFDASLEPAVPHRPISSTAAGKPPTDPDAPLLSTDIDPDSTDGRDTTQPPSPALGTCSSTRRGKLTVPPVWFDPTDTPKQCCGYIRYSVCYNEVRTMTGSRQRRNTQSDRNLRELRVAVVSLFALNEVNGSSHVLVQVELLSPDGEVRTPALFTKNKSAIRHTRPVVRVCTSVIQQDVYIDGGDSMQDSPAGPVVNGEDDEDSGLLPLQQRWPYQEELMPFLTREGQEDLSQYHLRFTVWVRETVLADRVAADATSVTAAGGGDSAMETDECVAPGVPKTSSNWSISSGSSTRSSTGSARRMANMVRSGSAHAQPKPKPSYSVRQVGEIIVRLDEFQPLTVPHTRTDELASPLTEEQIKELYRRTFSPKRSVVVNPNLCMPGCLKVSLHYSQNPIHSISVCATAQATLPAFMDDSRNKLRDTFLKLTISVNGKQQKQYSSMVVRKSRNPNYRMRETFHMSDISLDRDDIEIALAIKAHRSAHIGSRRSKSFAVRRLHFGMSTDSDTCRSHWLRAISHPGHVIMTEHVLEMDLSKLRGLPRL